MVNIYLESTIKAPQKGPGRAMWIVELVKDDNPEKIVTRQGLTEFAETTEDAIILTILSEALMIIGKPCTIRIFTKAQGVFWTLETRRYAGWKRAKWQRDSVKSTKNAHLWEIISHALEKKATEWTVTDEEHSYQNYMRTELRKWQ